MGHSMSCHTCHILLRMLEVLPFAHHNHEPMFSTKKSSVRKTCYLPKKSSVRKSAAELGAVLAHPSSWAQGRGGGGDTFLANFIHLRYGAHSRCMQ